MSCSQHISGLMASWQHLRPPPPPPLRHRPPCAAGRVWDLRTGRSVHVLSGHVKQVLAVACAPDGWHIATGSEDHSVKVGG